MCCAHQCFVRFFYVRYRYPALRSATLNQRQSLWKVLNRLSQRQYRKARYAVTGLTALLKKVNANSRLND
jgi:hypothetical protein